MSSIPERIRSALFTAASAVLLVVLFGVDCAAMLYKPSAGRFKDGFILWHEGQFYLFSMYTPGDEAGFRNVWLATSRDVATAPTDLVAELVDRDGVGRRAEVGQRGGLRRELIGVGRRPRQLHVAVVAELRLDALAQESATELLLALVGDDPSLEPLACAFPPLVIRGRRLLRLGLFSRSGSLSS